MTKSMVIRAGLDNDGPVRPGGRVFRVRQGGQLRAVRVFPLPDEAVEGDAMIRDFQRLCTQMQSLSGQPGADDPKVLGSGFTHTGGLPYLEMEWVEGTSLDDRLPTSGPLSLQEVVKLTEQTARRLALCHSLDIVHGQIAPCHIRYQPTTDRYMLLGFGGALTAAAFP